MCHHAGHDPGGTVHGGDACALHKHTGARGVELDQLAHVFGHIRRHDQPAQTPAGHQKAFGKAVRHHQPVLRRSDIQKTRGAAVLSRQVIQVFIDFVRQYPGAGASAVIQQDLLFGAAEGPAGRVVGRIDHQQAGLGRHRRQQFRHGQRPTAVLWFQTHRAQVSAQNHRLRGQVRPDRRDHHHLLARVEQRLHGQHQGVHPA